MSHICDTGLIWVKPYLNGKNQKTVMSECWENAVTDRWAGLFNTFKDNIKDIKQEKINKTHKQENR